LDFVEALVPMEQVAANRVEKLQNCRAALIVAVTAKLAEELQIGFGLRLCRNQIKRDSKPATAGCPVFKDRNDR